jgi:hypothetical protein
MAGLPPESAHADAHTGAAGGHAPVQTSTSGAEGGDHD